MNSEEKWVFDSLELVSDGLLRLEVNVISEDSEIKFTLDQLGWKFGRVENPHQTKFAFTDLTRRLNWEIGDHTYGVPLVYAQSKERLIIGKYCSFGGHVTIVLSSHRHNFASTYPFVVHRQSWPGLPDGHKDHLGKGDVIIGNDVWLGHGCFIASGVKIGDGAVIGAQAVVIRDVPPYAIVAGNPARHIRFRFDVATMQELLKICWWDWPNEKVEAYLSLILSDDIQRFVKTAKEI